MAGLEISNVEEGERYRRKVAEYRDLAVGDRVLACDEIYNTRNQRWVCVAVSDFTLKSSAEAKGYRRKIETEKLERKPAPKPSLKWTLLPNGNIAYLGQNVTIPISKENIVDILNGYEVEL
jgi:hypothetical protein